MRRQVETILGGVPLQWEEVDVDTDPDLARRYGESIPILFVNGRLFAKIRLPRLAAALRLRRAADRPRRPGPKSKAQSPK
jgi:hypothetical protein